MTDKSDYEKIKESLGDKIVQGKETIKDVVEFFSPLLGASVPGEPNKNGDVFDKDTKVTLPEKPMVFKHDEKENATHMAKGDDVVRTADGRIISMDAYRLEQRENVTCHHDPNFECGCPNRAHGHVPGINGPLHFDVETSDYWQFSNYPIKTTINPPTFEIEIHPETLEIHPDATARTEMLTQMREEEKEICYSAAYVKKLKRIIGFLLEEIDQEDMALDVSHVKPDI